MINHVRIEKGKRFLMLFAHHLTAVMAVVCSVIIFSGSYFKIGSQNVSTDVIYPWEEGTSYEDSSIFESHMQSGINDIVRMAVIRDQMESEGSYDGRKTVDIAAFVNRKTSYFNTEELSAKYYLEDLIKWQEYGFTYTYITESPSEKNRYFEDYRREHPWYNADGKRVYIVNSGDMVLEEIAEAESMMRAASEENTAVAGVDSDASSAVAQDVSDPVYEEHRLLDERYATVDGRSILDFVSTWEEYEEYLSILAAACEQLAYNYKEYRSFDEYYGAGATNFRYCVEMPSVDGVKYFTNDEAVEGIDSDDRITEHFRSYGKFLYYYPEHLDYESNTKISEEEIRRYVSRYSYAYTEDTRIWIAVDTAYPAQDAISAGQAQYGAIMPVYGWLLAAVFGGLLLYVILFIALTLSEGGADKERILKSVDYIPAEVMTGLAAAAGLILTYVVFLIGSIAAQSAFRQAWFPAACGITAFLANLTFMFFYLSLVRRLKAHVFWKHTLIVKIIFWNVRWMKRGWELFLKAAGSLYRNKSVVVRTWAPYMVFLLMNFVIIAWVLESGDEGWFLLALLMDLAVGIFQYRVNRTRQKIVDGIRQIREGNLSYQIDTARLFGDNFTLAEAVNNIGEGIREAVETSMKDERLKADLITNVSHDIKTPLTSIINYVDLIKREEIQDEKIKGYVQVLDSKSQRLKQLTEDLVEASKISSGNIVYHFETINFVELIHQTLGEFSEKFEQKELTIVTKLPELPVLIEADSRRIWRIVENLYNNLYKYVFPGTRVYLDMEVIEEDGKRMASLSIKNISAQPLNIDADELTERFIRGDVSRSTEGSGLGLSIAKNLTQAQHGSFTIYLDGDLFKVILKFPVKE